MFMKCVATTSIMLVAHIALLSGVYKAVADEAWPVFTDVFHKDQGYAYYRIPSIVCTNHGVLLAFAEGRQSISDHSENDIVMKRSLDQGNTWSDMVVIAEAGRNCLNNPQAVVLLDSNKVILFYQFNPEAYHSRAMGDTIKILRPGISGPDVDLCFMISSDDDGMTWSSPRDITAQTKRPTKIISFAGGPGIGIVLQHEPFRGRIVMPFCENWVEEDESRPFYIYSVYSDDGGETWQYGQDNTYDRSHPDDIGFGNECQMVELADGTVMVNSRSSKGNKYRKIAYSKDGGVSWSALLDDRQLPEPECMGSIIRYSWPTDGQKSRLLFSCPANQEGRPGTRKSRKIGTIYLSEDEGKTWPVSRVLYEMGYAYSCLTVLDDGTIGCLIEKDDLDTITFARFTMDWLTAGQTSAVSEAVAK